MLTERDSLWINLHCNKSAGCKIFVFSIMSKYTKDVKHTGRSVEQTGYHR